MKERKREKLCFLPTGNQKAFLSEETTVGHMMQEIS